MFGFLFSEIRSLAAKALHKMAPLNPDYLQQSLTMAIIPSISNIDLNRFAIEQ